MLAIPRSWHRASAGSVARALLATPSASGGPPLSAWNRASIGSAARTFASSSSKPPPGAVPKDTPKFGKQIAEDGEAPAQLMHDISKGKFNYLGDFVKSMDKGPVKLDFGKEAKPVSEKQKKLDEMNERNLKMIQRSLVLGSLLAGVSCALGWQFTKWYYGVKNIAEFTEVMNERMPKVSGKLEDSAVGRQLQALSEESRDAIAESERITEWRRGIRAKFNTPEGAAVARQNSMVMAERREAEKSMRKSRQPLPSTTGASGAEGEGGEGAYPEHAALAAALAAEVEAEAEAEAAAAPPPATRLQRSLSARVFEGAVEGSYQMIVGRRKEGAGEGEAAGAAGAAQKPTTPSSPTMEGAGGKAGAGAGSGEAEAPKLQRSLSARVLEGARDLIVGKPKAGGGGEEPPAAAAAAK